MRSVDSETLPVRRVNRGSMQQQITAPVDFAQIAVPWDREMEQSQQRIEASQRRRDELLQQLVQAVAVMQAEIVRIDKTLS